MLGGSVINTTLGFPVLDGGCETKGKKPQKEKRKERDFNEAKKLPWLNCTHTFLLCNSERARVRERDCREGFDEDGGVARNVGLVGKWGCVSVCVSTCCKVGFPLSFLFYFKKR